MVGDLAKWREPAPPKLILDEDKTTKPNTDQGKHMAADQVLPKGCWFEPALRHQLKHSWLLQKRTQFIRRVENCLEFLLVILSGSQGRIARWVGCEIWMQFHLER